MTLFHDLIQQDTICDLIVIKASFIIYHHAQEAFHIREFEQLRRQQQRTRRLKSDFAAFENTLLILCLLQPDECWRIFLKLAFYWPHLCSEKDRGNRRFVITSSIKREIRIFVNGKEPACERLAHCFSLCFDWLSKIGGNVFFLVSWIAYECKAKEISPLSVAPALRRSILFSFQLNFLIRVYEYYCTLTLRSFWTFSPWWVAN